MSADLILYGNEPPLSQQPAAVYLAALPSDESKRTMGKALSAVADILGGAGEGARQRLAFTSIRWSALGYQHTTAIRARLLERYSPATVRLYLSALRGVLYQAWKLGQMSSEEYQRAADLESVSGETSPAGRELSSGEIAALMAACQKDRTPAGVRVAAIIALLYAA